MQLATMFQRKKHIRDDAPLFTAINYIWAVIYCFLILTPMYFVFISSFKSNFEIFNGLLRLPTEINLDNYRRAIEFGSLFKALWVSFYVTIGAEVVTLGLAFPVAFAIARIPTRLSNWTEGLFGLGFLIPGMAMLVPILLLMVSLKLYHNPLGLVAVYPATALPGSVILLASTLRGIPKELEESAQMDGANRLQMVWHIFLPLSTAGVVTVIILNFLSFWSEYIFALVLLGTDTRTIQLAVTGLKSQRLIDYGLVAAGAVISMVPVFIIFLFFQERIMSGMLAGAVKQ
jgi:multiple sugar transport system permease protein